MAEDFSRAYTIEGVFQTGWEVLKKEPVGLLLGAFIVGASRSCNSQGSFPSDIDPSDPFAPELLGVFAVMMGIGIFLAFLGMLVRAWLEPGYLRHQRNLVMYGKSDIGTVFTATDAFMPMLGWYLLSGFISFGLGALMLVPGAGLVWYGFDREMVAATLGGVLVLCVGIFGAIYVGLGLFFGSRLVALDGLTAMEALGKSWELAAGNRVGLFVLNALIGIGVAFIGCSTCLIGFIPLGAITDSGLTAAYLRFTRDDAGGYAMIGGGGAGVG